MEMHQLLKSILKFRDDRDWAQFHTPKNLAASVCIEAAELMQEFQWTSADHVTQIGEANASKVADEIADVAIYLMLLAHTLEIDLEGAIVAKLAKNSDKYPIEKAKGSSKKYTEP